MNLRCRWVSLFVLFFCFVCSDESAVAYHFSSGRFGDNLLTYLHAKWFSYKTGSHVLYQRFPYSDMLKLSEIEKVGGEYSQSAWLCETDDPVSFFKKVSSTGSTVFHIKYFPELSWGGECLNIKPKFHINWDDPEFNKLIRSSITPKEKLNYSIVPPKDKVSVAIHFRSGGAKERDLHQKWPLKAPRLEFYIKQLKNLYSFLEESSLYVYIFTDSDYPEDIKATFKKMFKGDKIHFDISRKIRKWNDHVLEDFFSMSQFNCLIHARSNYSVCAGLIFDFDVEICPISDVGQEGIEKIDHVVMRTHFDKSIKPEYQYVSM